MTAADVIYQGVPRLRRLARVRRLPRAAGDDGHRTRPWTRSSRGTRSRTPCSSSRFYSHELGRIQGRLPERMHVVLGTGDARAFRPADFAAYYRRVRARFLDVRRARARDRTPTRSTTAGSATSTPVCDERWERRRPPDRVASIRRDQIERLELAGIATLEALGDTPAGTRRRRGSRRATFETLRHQAALQLERAAHRRAPLRAARCRRSGAASACSRRPRRATSSTTSRATRSGSPGAGSSTCTGSRDTRRRVHRDLGARPRRGAARARARRSTSSTSGSPRTRTCTSTTTPPTRPTALKRLVAEHGDRARTSSTSSSAARSSSTSTRSSRQALRISYPSYSIKKVREFFMDATEELERRATTRSSSTSVARRARPRDPRRRSSATTRRTASRPCRLRDWLRRAQGGGGGAVRHRDPVARAARAARADRGGGRRSRSARAELRDRAARGAATRRSTLMGDLLEYHRREARPVWWWFFARCEMTPGAARRGLASRSAALEPDGSSRRGRRSRLVARLPLPGAAAQARRRATTSSTRVTGRRRRRRSSRSTTVAGHARRCGAGRRSRTCRCRQALIPGGPWTTKRRSRRRSCALGARCSRATGATRTSRSCCGASRRSAARACSARRSRRCGRLDPRGRGLVPLRPGPARLGQDVDGRAADHVPASRAASGSASPRRATRRSTSCSREVEADALETGVRSAG